MAENSAGSGLDSLTDLPMIEESVTNPSIDLLAEGSTARSSVGSNTPSTLGNSQISTANNEPSEDQDELIGSKRGRGAERRNETMKHFELLKAGKKEFSGIYKCKYCMGKKLNWENSAWNSTVAVKHLLECPLVPDDLKQELSMGSCGYQKATKFRKQLLGASDGSNMSFACSRSTQSSQLPSSIETKSKRTSKKKVANYFAPPHSKSVLSEDYATKVIHSRIEEYLSKYVSPSWLLSDYSIASLNICCGDGIQQYIPSIDEIWTIVNNIDVESEKWLIKMLKQQPGNLNVGFDGVTVLGQSCLLYTVSKGEIALFVTISHLEERVHDSTAEVKDAVMVLSRLRRLIGSPISSAAVNNATKSVAGRALDAYKLCHPLNPTPLRVRDPAHCLDLVAKDFGKSKACAVILANVSDMVKLLTTDGVARICEKICSNSLTMVFTKVVSKSDTRFYGTADELESIYKNRVLLGSLYTDPLFEEYLNSREKKRKESIEKILRVLSVPFWDAVKFLLKLFNPLKEAITAVSREDMPMSAYYPICVSLQKLLVQLFAQEPNVDGMLGVQGGCIELLKLVETRFNMDGADPAGMKVGLLDPYQIWCFVVDPFQLYLKPTVPLGHTPAIGHLSNAVDFYLHESSSKETLAASIMKEYDPIQARVGKYMYKYRAHGEPPDDPAFSVELSIADVVVWVEKYGCLNGRLTFFFGEEYEKTNYCKMVAGPLLSLKTTGSISVERAAKPLKHGVQTPVRNSLSHAKKIMCLRAGMNLNLKMQLRKRAQTTANSCPHGAEVRINSTR